MSKYTKLKKDLLNSNDYQARIDKDNKISICIDNTSQLISPYCENNNIVIDNDFADFLNNSAKPIDIKQNLILEFSTKDNDLSTISKAIKNYYYKEFFDTQRKLKLNLLFSICTLIIGLIALSVSLLQIILNLPILAGAIDVFAWVFIWEAVDLFFFRRSELKHEQYRQINFINATVIKK